MSHNPTPDLFVTPERVSDTCRCEDLRVYFASEKDVIEISKSVSKGEIVKKGETLVYIEENSLDSCDLGCGSIYYGLDVLDEEDIEGHREERRRRRRWELYHAWYDREITRYETYDELLERAVKK
jgi:hypothetical protein